MRVAVVADLHGRTAAWERVRADLDRRSIDRVLCLGDYLDCRVSERRPIVAKRRAAAEIVDVDPAFWAALARCDLVRGNQEERIAALFEPADIPVGLVPLLDAPTVWRQWGCVFAHGHQLAWSSHSIPPWQPAADEITESPLVIVGHSHVPQILTRSAEKDGWRSIPVVAESWRVIEPGERLLVNAAPARIAPSPWLQLDVEDGPGGRVRAFVFRHAL